MDLKEVDDISLLEEREHWWIKTRFLYIDKSVSCINNDTFSVIEYGCGTAQNLWYLGEKSSHRRQVINMLGVDPGLPDDFELDWDSEGKVALSRDIMDKQRKAAELVLAMDVLEHVPNPEDSLRYWASTLEQDGVMLLTVPAFQSLWSYHDEFLEHYKRYTKEEVLELARLAGLEPIQLGYAFSYLFPVAYVYRKLFGKGNSKQAFNLPSTAINSFMLGAGKLEMFLGGFPLFGTSVIGIFRKR